MQLGDQGIDSGLSQGRDDALITGSQPAEFNRKVQPQALGLKLRVVPTHGDHIGRKVKGRGMNPCILDESGVANLWEMHIERRHQTSIDAGMISSGITVTQFIFMDFHQFEMPGLGGAWRRRNAGKPGPIDQDGRAELRQGPTPILSREID